MKPQSAKQNPLALLVDELGALEKRALEWKPALSRIEALRKLLRVSADGLEPDAGVNIYGEDYLALIGARATERTVNTLKLQRLIGSKAFGVVASCTLARLREAEIKPLVIAQVIESAASGPRPLHVTAR